MSILIGKQAEKAAEEYLLKQGLKIMERNYLCKLGEIDLIMLAQDCLVFVEVRHRKSFAYGGAIASITYAKQQKICRTAQHYIQNHPQKYDCGYRFDVVLFQGNITEASWIQNAFTN